MHISVTSQIKINNKYNMAFLDIFKKKKDENVGGMEDFMTLIRVYFQSVLASNLGISNLAALPDQQQVGCRREKSVCKIAPRPIWH